MERLRGLRAVVTGAGRGIGRAIAIRFADEGADVALFARTSSDLEAVAREATASGVRALSVAGDVLDDGDVGRLADEVSSRFGGVDVLVNNAGIYLPGRFLDYDMGDWERSLAVNLLGTVRVTRAFLPVMLEQGGGRIINMASTAGKWGTANQSVYNSAKHAILGLTRSLALEVAAAGVRVTAVCPSWVDTEFVDREQFARVHGIPAGQVDSVMAARAPIGRMITGDEVAGLAAYLASPEADAMTGVGITMAGGMVLV
jgi:NAD(P)-dependent dehydrogenase (short-subunit alcohol dehydrogenase family)